MKERSTEKEWMDDLTLDSPMLVKTLDEIAMMNRLLGGHRAVINGIDEILEHLKVPIDSPLNIIDAGCGKGDCLHAIYKKFKGERALRLTGIDASAKTIAHARSTFGNEEIKFVQEYVNPRFVAALETDILIFSLFLHHFSDEEITAILQAVDPTKVKAILISDLQRSRIPMILYKFAGLILNLNPMARNDGMISIKKGFTKSEWRGYFRKISCELLSIEWTFAFRHRIIAIL